MILIWGIIITVKNHCAKVGVIITQKQIQPHKQFSTWNGTKSVKHMATKSSRVGFYGKLELWIIMES